MNEGTISKRIVELMELNHLRQVDFQKIIGVEAKSTISRIINGYVSPSYDNLYKILEAFPDISGTWLITGRGPMKTTNELIAVKDQGCHECAAKQLLIEEKERSIQNLERTIQILMAK